MWAEKSKDQISEIPNLIHKKIREMARKEGPIT
jgi:hypothetical protein